MGESAGRMIYMGVRGIVSRYQSFVVTFDSFK